LKNEKSLVKQTQEQINEEEKEFDEILRSM